MSDESWSIESDDRMCHFCLGFFLPHKQPTVVYGDIPSVDRASTVVVLRDVFIIQSLFNTIAYTHLPLFNVGNGHWGGGSEG